VQFATRFLDILDRLRVQTIHPQGNRSRSARYTMTQEILFYEAFELGQETR
jgi:hypothetical protein